MASELTNTEQMWVAKMVAQHSAANAETNPGVTRALDMMRSDAAEEMVKAEDKRTEAIATLGVTLASSIAQATEGEFAWAREDAAGHVNDMLLTLSATTRVTEKIIDRIQGNDDSEFSESIYDMRRPLVALIAEAVRAGVPVTQVVELVEA